MYAGKNIPTWGANIHDTYRSTNKVTTWFSRECGIITVLWCLGKYWCLSPELVSHETGAQSELSPGFAQHQ
jgi:hypothetical protein